MRDESSDAVASLYMIRSHSRLAVFKQNGHVPGHSKTVYCLCSHEDGWPSWVQYKDLLV